MTWTWSSAPSAGALAGAVRASLPRPPPPAAPSAPWRTRRTRASAWAARGASAAAASSRRGPSRGSRAWRRRGSGRGTSRTRDSGWVQEPVGPEGWSPLATAEWLHFVGYKNKFLFKRKRSLLVFCSDGQTIALFYFLLSFF